MSDVTGGTENEEQYVELLPARTVLSLLSMVDPGTDGTPGIPGTSDTGAVPDTWLPLGSQSSSVDGSPGSSDS